MAFLLQECGTSWARRLSAGSLIAVLAFMTGSQSRADETEEAIKKKVAAMSNAFDKQDAAALADVFLPDGEMLNEEGTIYKGREELIELFRSFFNRFPGAKLTLDVESVRAIGPRAGDRRRLSNNHNIRRRVAGGTALRVSLVEGRRPMETRFDA